MVLMFIVVEFNWMCVVNYCLCNLIGEFKFGDDLYMKWCDMLRDFWKFVDDYMLVVIEVRIY